MRQKVRLLPVLLLCLCVVACAARNPNLTSDTARDLNLAFQLDQSNEDYITFFTDVGDAAREGRLNSSQVQTLNRIGNVVKVALENANATMKTYQSNKTESVRNQVLAYLKQATDGLAQLFQQRDAILTRGAQ